jgi:hypothetical protein
VAGEGDLGAGVGFLQLNAPVAQVGECDRLAAHCAPHEVAWDKDLELTVEIAKPGLAPETEEPLKPIHAPSPFGTEDSSSPFGLAQVIAWKIASTAIDPAPRPWAP